MTHGLAMDYNSTLPLYGAGAPATTPQFIGQIYVDTTAKRWYKAVATSASTDWKKEAAFFSGTVTVTAGAGDVTVTVPWDWTGGSLQIFASDGTTYYVAGPTGVVYDTQWTSYDALTAVGYSANNGVGTIINTTQNELFTQAKADNRTANPKSATTTTFVLDDDTTNTAYVKYFITA